MDRKISDSITEVTHLVLPNDTNPLGFLRGGVLMEWMDIAAEITAQKHSHKVALTIAIDAVVFKSPIRTGDTVHIRTRVTRAFNTSMEIYAEVWASNLPDMQFKKTNEAFFTFVSVEKDGTPAPIPGVWPDSKEELRLFNGALARKNKKVEGRLINPVSN